MQYRIIRTGEEPDSFEHALFGGGRQKGVQNKNHKYLARAWWKNKWRYAYTEAEVRALQMLGKAKQTANDVKEKAQSTAEKAKSVATGQYSKDIEKKASTAKQNIARASEEKSKAQSQAKAASVRQDKYSGGLYPAFKGGKEKAANASNAQARAEKNAADAEKSRQKYQAELASAARERESTAYKVSEGINNAKDKASETASKVSNAAKSTVNVGKDIVSSFSDAAKDKAKEISEAWKDDGPRKVADAARDVSSQIGKSVKTAAEAATGKYSKDVDSRLSKANENYNRASEDLEKQRQLRDAAGKRRSSGNENANAAYERASNNAKEAERKAASSKFEQLAIQKEQKSTAYKVSEGVNNAKDKVSETAKKAGDAAKSVADKGKAKVDELFSGIKKTDNQSETVTRSSDSEVTRGRKYEGTGHKAEARKEEGGVAGGPVSGNTNMQGRGEEKKTSLKEKASDLAKKASDVADAVKLGAHLTKKNVENYLNDDNGKVVTDTAGKSTLKGQKVTTSYSEGDSLLSKSTLTKKKNEDGTVEYEHHTEYGKIAQATKKGKEAVENLFSKNKTQKTYEPKELKEQGYSWLYFKNSEGSSNKSLSETMEKGKSKAQEVLNKVSNTAKAAAAKAYDKVTDDIEKVRESDAMAYANKAAEKVKEKVSDAKDVIYDKAVDATASAQHVAEATKAKVKYGSDSLQYKEARAHVDYDKTVNALAKARDKYGVDSPQYRQAVANEAKAREEWQGAREQNLYKNNKEYRTYSDRASYLGSYLDNWDKKGGPQTAEGKANYQKMLNELRGLENKLDTMKRG